MIASETVSSTVLAAAPIGTDGALIGGIVGGVAALLLVVTGVVGFFVCRARKVVAAPVGKQMQSSLYGAVDLARGDYGRGPHGNYVVGNVDKLPPNDYGVVNEPRYADPAVLRDD